jgi:predicted NUDIX family NTP pyrophosphohydrolase
MYRVVSNRLEVLLIHPGGPYWRNKDDGAWSIPKGEPDEGETLMEAARREFREELGWDPGGPLVELSPIKQKAGKMVYAWAFEGDGDPSAIESNSFTMEWPPRSGRQMQFPEVDRAEFFEIETAKNKINPAQVGLLEQLVDKLRAR